MYRKYIYNRMIENILISPYKYDIIYYIDNDISHLIIHRRITIVCYQI